MNTLQKRLEQRGQGGFTLIELLVVIAILAILAGVVVFAVGNSTDNAEVSSCKTERSSIITAIAAAETANKVNHSNAKEGMAQYLSNPTLKYFTVTGATVDSSQNPDTAVAFSGASRTSGTLTAVPAADCAALTTTDVQFSTI